MFRITFRDFSTGSRICSFEKERKEKKEKGFLNPELRADTEIPCATQQDQAPITSNHLSMTLSTVSLV